MGELTPSMKERLHQLVDESDTDAIFDLVSAIHEGDLDVPYRLTADFTPPQWNWLEGKAAELHMRGIAPVLRFVLDAVIEGDGEAIRKAIIDGTYKKPPAKGQRKR